MSEVNPSVSEVTDAVRRAIQDAAVLPARVVAETNAADATARGEMQGQVRRIADKVDLLVSESAVSRAHIEMILAAHQDFTRKLSAHDVNTAAIDTRVTILEEAARFARANTKSWAVWITVGLIAVGTLYEVATGNLRLRSLEPQMSQSTQAK